MPETFVGAEQMKIPQGARDRVLARVGDQDVRASDLYQLMFVSFNRETTDAIKKSILNLIVAKEAARIGARVPDSQIAAEQERLLGEQKRQFQESYKGSLSFEDYVNVNLRLEPAAYQAVLRQAVVENLFLERVVRFESRLEERRAARVLVVRDRTKAEALRGDLQSGASFDSIARRESIDPTREQGGLLPALPVSFKSPLTDGIEGLAAGELSPVLAMGDGQVTLYKIMKLEEILPADPRPYAEQEDELRTDTERRPVHPAELLAWEKKMWQRYAISDYVGREQPAAN
ncbi:MAG: peptidyl-prolyl cis-trans isomerase [Planctomycetota bacterium]